MRLFQQPAGPLRRALHFAENGAAFASLLLIALLPAIEVVTRLFRTGVVGSAEYVQHLVLWATFAGAMITSREGRHLALTAGLSVVKEPVRSVLAACTSATASGVCACLAWNAFLFVRDGFDPAAKIGFAPLQAVLWIMPAGFAVMAVRFVTHAPRGFAFKLIAAIGPAIVALVGFVFACHIQNFVWPIAAVLVASAVFGAPIFTVLGGFAALLFPATGGSATTIPNEAYTMLTGPMIPTIPLFTLAGFILSESKAGERLVALFHAVLGWMPGGLAVMSILICAFFTALTGISGVTILAVGGLLYIVLVKSKYDENFTAGLLAVNGIGILFPPSLPIIMYGVTAHISIQKMFVAMLAPATVALVSLVVVAVVRSTAKRKVQRVPFRVANVVSALQGALFEILIPVIIVVLFFGGITTLVETAAITVLYVLLVETVIHRDIRFSALPAALLKSVPIIGGVLAILSVAKGLSYFIVDMQIPMQLAQWLQATISSKYVFLILLNLALLVVGGFMDVFSATIVVVPLILPLAQIYGINPLHLGAIFLANLEIGYLTPPVGLNLFLASYRFNKPLAVVVKSVLPFLLTLFAALLVITYVPWLSTFLVDVFFK